MSRTVKIRTDLFSLSFGRLFAALLFSFLPQAGGGVLIGSSGGKPLDLFFEVQISGDLITWSEAATYNRKIDLPEGKRFLRVAFADMAFSETENAPPNLTDPQSGEIHNIIITRPVISAGDPSSIELEISIFVESDGSAWKHKETITQSDASDDDRKFYRISLDTSPPDFVADLDAGLNKTIVVYGGDPTATGAWVGQMDNWLSGLYPGQINLINSGLVGMNSAEGLMQLQSGVLTHHPDVVFIAFAMNDALSDSDGNPELSIQQARDNLIEMIGTTQAQNPDVEIILQTMNPVWDSPLGSGSSDTIRPHLDEYYQMYREVAETQDLFLIDHHSHWVKLQDEDPAVFQSYLPDGETPSELGAEIMKMPLLNWKISGEQPMIVNGNSDAQRIILDSDYGPDVDDAVAHALLHGLANLGECQIIAGIVCISNAKSPGAMNAFDTWHGRGDIPVGGSDTGSLFTKGGAGESDGAAWAAALYDDVAAYPRSITDSNYPTALSVYRQALSGSPDGSVKIVTVGMLNTLSQLLDSPADAIDSRSGAELLKAKVSAVYIMGGRDSGAEFNMRHAPSAATNVAANCPVPIYWSQFEIGLPVYTGKWTGNQHDGHILRFAMEEFNFIPGSDGKGRQSWDAMNVLVAVRGEAAGFSFTQGTMAINPSNGGSTWSGGAGPHYRVGKTLSTSDYEEVIENLLFHPRS